MNYSDYLVYEEIISHTEPNKSVLHKAVCELSKKLDGRLSVDEIYDLLNKADFKGLYILPDNLYNELIGSSAAEFLNYLGIIVANENDLKEYGIRLIVHELYHALLNKFDKTLFKEYPNCDDLLYISAEEGIASLVEFYKSPYPYDNVYYELRNVMEIIDKLYKAYPNKKRDSIIELGITDADTMYKSIKDMISYYLKSGNDTLTDEECDSLSSSILYNILRYNTVTYKFTGYFKENEQNDAISDINILYNDIYTILNGLLVISNNQPVYIESLGFITKNKTNKELVDMIIDSVSTIKNSTLKLY